MSGILVLEQILNGLQFGLMLFLLAAGLTLVFGIMDMINLAHGSLYMIGRVPRGGGGAGDGLVLARSPAGDGRRR
jgi:branched-chain amino acid transport system permease protein